MDPIDQCKLAVAFDISWLFMGIEDFKRTVIRNTIVKLASMIMIFTLVRDANDVAFVYFYYWCIDLLLEI